MSSERSRSGARQMLLQDVKPRADVILGHGYYGRVVEGSWKGQTVAIKQLYEQHQSEMLTRELLALDRLRHPHIVEVFGSCELPGPVAGSPPAVAIVMERMDCNLYERCKKMADCEPLRPSSMVDIFLDVSSALEFIHAENFIHRDITPENILLKGPMDFPRAKLSDFGLAKLAAGNGKLLTKAPGTPTYMSPESLKPEAGETDEKGNAKAKYDAKHDIFSLGIVMLEVVTGQQRIEYYFADDSTEKTLREHLALVSKRASLLRSIITACVSYSPGQRPVSRELHDQLLTVSTGLRTQPYKEGGKDHGSVDTFAALPAMTVAQPERDVLRRMTEERDELKRDRDEVKRELDNLRGMARQAREVGAGGGWVQFSLQASLTFETLNKLHEVYSWEEVSSVGQINSLCFATYFNGCVYIAASEKADSDQTQMMLFFSAASDLKTWRKITGPPRSSRPEKLAVYQGRLYVLVRSDDLSKAKKGSAPVILWQLENEDEGQWKEITVFPGEARSSLISAIIEHLLVVCGGQDSAGTSLDTVHAYNMLTGHWSDWPNLPKKLNGSSMVELNGHLLLCSGRTRFEGAILDGSRTIYWIDPHNPREWQVHSSSPVPRVGTALVSGNGNLVAAGGRGEYNQVHPEVYFWNSEIGKWLELPRLCKAAAMSSLIHCPNGQTNRLLWIGGYHEQHIPSGTLQCLTLL